MSLRYTTDELKVLRESPLVKKPSSLPPAEQWMGPPADPTRNPPNERTKNYDSDLILDQPNKRPGAERHVPRNSANPEDIILGPPKTSFMSATSIRSSGKSFDSLDRTPTRDTATRERFDFRSKNGDGDNDRRDARNNNLRVRRNDGDQDNDGWSTVKPRKSFGNEGAERFNGRMGLDRHKDDRRFKDREDRDVKDRPPRGFDTYARDKDHEDQERDGRRNGTGRGRNEPSWFKDNGDGPAPSKDRNSNGDKFMDRSRGWREKEREDKEDRGGDKNDRGDRRERGDRGNQRWDRERDQRQERDPEWMDEPQEEKPQAHTQEEFQKWKESMQGKDKSTKTPVDDSPPDNGGGFFGLESPAQKVETPLAIDTGPDKFFGKWATPKDEVSPESGVESRKEGIAKAKTTGKASRFTSFFTPQEEPARRQTEPPPPMPMQQQGGLEAMFAGAGSNSSSQSNAEKEAFQMLLQKLQMNQPPPQAGSTPPPNAAMQHQKPPLVQEKQQHIPISTPEPFQQYRTERHGEGRQPVNSSHQAVQDLLAQRQIANSQPALRDQMMHDLGGQRQNAMSQASLRSDQSGRNSQSEFLMGLMKAAPEPQRSEQVLLRMQPGQKERHMQQQHQQQQQQQMMMEREQEMQQREAAAHRERERSASQRQIRQPPPGFYDHEPQQQGFQRGPPPQHERQPGNPVHPTQILQRPGPPGLGPDIGWDRPTQQLPPQHRIPNIPPPPGLGTNGPNRAMPMPQQMFPPGFPMGNFPPEGMPGPPRMGPGGFFGAPPQAPPGFLPPGMNGFPGPEGMAFGGPFDGRGPPPQGNFRRQ
ncbi:hypothetical protein HYALB_00010046 [Hymenoscyphus albidus]|uniref:Uncharacterized protein n=1 Tax=Hymenoscyphus albidus TaxID=595503 RepID=A0A9N9LMX6_9HELO|nr:hypothetical protein HYALB_00010046 [Hymenoscyphus albidus]